MFEAFVSQLNSLVWDTGIPVGDQSIPFIVIALLGTGMLFTFRLGFIQLRHLGHGFGVATGINSFGIAELASLSQQFKCDGRNLAVRGFCMYPDSSHSRLLR